jgi:ubiquinone biosynthesis protein
MRIFRLFTILRVLIRHGLDEALLSIPRLKWLYYAAPWNWHSQKNSRPQGERLRKALEDLGPIFVKLGQMLSTRRDLVPTHIVDELAKLQDDVPPFPNHEARAIIEKSLGRSVTKVFKHFEVAPLASASIAQVHAATLWDGTDVIIKVVRPSIAKVIHKDIALLYILARLAQRYWKHGKRLRPVDIIQEYEKTIIDELDLVREASNASQLRRNFEDSDDLYVPEIYWDYCSKNVIVMERIYGLPIGEIDTLKAMGVDMQRLSERGVEIFFSQVFRHNFFHADMHPGNIFVDTSNLLDAKYLAVDFGIMGTLSPDDQRYLAENFHAFFSRDYKRVAELHIESGWVPAGTRIEEFEAAIRSVCEPIFQRPIAEISFGNLLLSLFQTAQRFDMEVQPQLILLQKTMLNIEGLGRELYPDLDLWVTAKPFIQQWMDEQVGIHSLLNGAKKNIPKMLKNFPEMPNLIHDVLQQINQQQVKMQFESKQLQQLRQEIQQGNKANRLAIVGGTLLIAASLSAATPVGIGVLTWISASSGITLLVYSLLK